MCPPTKEHPFRFTQCVRFFALFAILHTVSAFCEAQSCQQHICILGLEVDIQSPFCIKDGKERHFEVYIFELLKNRKQVVATGSIAQHVIRIPEMTDTRYKTLETNGVVWFYRKVKHKLHCYGQVKGTSIVTTPAFTMLITDPAYVRSPQLLFQTINARDTEPA